MTSSQSYNIRRVKFDDFKAVMDINDNIYDGLDYMKTMFNIFLQSKQHVMYVAEKDGKLIALANIRFHPEKNIISSMSARAHPSYAGLGIFGDKGSFVSRLLQEFPSVDTSIACGQIYNPAVEKKINQAEVLQRWNMLKYIITIDQIFTERLSSCPVSKSSSSYSCKLTYTKSVGMLNNYQGVEIERLLQNYATDYVPVHNTWTPININQSGLKEIFMSCRVYASYKAHADRLEPNLGSYKEKDFQQPEIEDSQGKALSSFSYSSSMPTNTAMVLCNIFIYGNNEKEMLQHFHAHLCHLTTIHGDVVVAVHFPLAIDPQNVEKDCQEITGVLKKGHMICAGYKMLLK